MGAVLLPTNIKSVSSLRQLIGIKREKQTNASSINFIIFFCLYIVFHVLQFFVMHIPRN